MDLAVLTGTATFLVWQRRSGEQRRSALVLFGVQLALNTTWTPMFFRLERIFAALIVIGLVWLSVFAMMILYFSATDLEVR